MTAPQNVYGPLGRAFSLTLADDDPFGVAVWIITAPSFDPATPQYALSVIRLRDDVPGRMPPQRTFAGATHELSVLPLDPTAGPYQQKNAAVRLAPWGMPIVALQFNAQDEEMTKLAQVCASAVINGALPLGELGVIAYPWRTSTLATLDEWRAQQGKHAVHRPHDLTETRIFPGLTLNDEHAIADVRKTTHDQLIADVGVARRSGVRWTQFTGRDEITDALDVLVASEFRDDAPPGAQAVARAQLDQARAFVTEHGDNAVMVVAMCEAVA